MNNDKKNLLRNGAWWSAADAFTTPFIIPFALAIGATNIAIGLINSLQYLSVLVSQVPGSEMVWVFKRRRLINNACEFLAKCSWLLVLAIPFLPPDSQLTVLIVSVALSSFFVNLSYPAWTSYIAELIRKEIRGRYFASRNMWMGFVSIIISLAVGFYLDLFQKGNLLGFVSIFVFGFFAGIMAITYFAKIKLKEAKLPKHSLLDYLNITKRMKRFLTFAAYFNFSYMLASPFMVVYMFENLKMDYGSYVLFAAIAAFAGLLSQKHWGRLIDKFGSRPMISIAVMGAALVPFFYIFINPSNLLFLIPVQLLSGVAWAGVGLVTFNMFLDTSEQEGRVIQTADYNMLTTFPMVIAPLIGGIIAQNFVFLLSGIPLVFLLSTALRFSSLALLKNIKEEHVKKKYETGQVLRVFVSVHPVRGMVHEIRAVGKKIGL
jgi:MFS family permease